MTCKYIYNGEELSYQELLERLQDVNNLEEFEAILFSKEINSKQDETKNKLEKLSKEAKFSKSSNILIDGVDIMVDENSFTTQTFIDSSYFNIDGDPDMFRLNRDDYVKIQKEAFMSRDGLTEEQANHKCSLILEHWDKIAKDASDLHRILVSSEENDSERSYMGAALNTAFYGIVDQLKPAVTSINKNIAEQQRNSKRLKNLNLEAIVKTTGSKIIGHIDYLFVKPNGDIEIFNIKASTEAESQWDAVKKEKFKYQLALLKKILEYNGIHARDIKMNIVPVNIEYDENFQNVIKVTPGRYVSYDTKDSQYIFQKYENVASQYIDSNIQTVDVDDTIFNKVNRQLQTIFPGRKIDIVTDGIKESAKGWVKKNWKHIARQAVDKKGWQILFPGEKESIYVEDTRTKDDNETVVQMAQQREEELFGNSVRAKTTYRIVDSIRKSYKDKKSFLSTGNRDEIEQMLKDRLNKYFEYIPDSTDPNKVGSYKWEMIDNTTLTNANILLFRNKKTDQLDIISLTPFEVDTKSKVHGRNNILGYYLPDLNSKNFTMEANYGNIEAVRTMTLLNEIIPELGNVRLGRLKVLSLSPYYNKKGRDIAMDQLLPEFETIVQTVKENNKSLDIENNFKKNNIKSIDPVDIIVETWREAVTSQPSKTNDIRITFKDALTGYVSVDGTAVDGLETIQDKDAKVAKLQELIEMIKKYDPVVANAKIDNLLELVNNHNSDTNSIQRATVAKMYINALRALNMYNGDLSLDNEYFSQLEEYVSKPQSIPNTNVRTVGYMFQRSIDKISNQMLERYSPIRKLIMDYFEHRGYTPAQNSMVGNHASQFKDLYERDLATGEKTMRFKNPYDMSVQFEDEYTREFLKKILFELNKVRHEMRGITWEYKDINDSKLISKVNNGELRYLNVPLMRVSNATLREDIGKNIKDWGKRWMKRIFNPKEAFKEFTEGMLNDEEKRQRDSDIERLQAYNPFLRSESSDNLRYNYIADKGTDYFETDLESIMVNFMEKHIQSVEFNKMLTRTKGILLDLQMRGIAEDDPEGIKHTVETIKDYLDVSVYNRSIMEPVSQTIENFLEPIRRAVSKCYIAANPIAMVRDLTEGLLQNMIKTLTKFQTDIDPSDVIHGYKEVITEGPRNLMKITKLNQLNLKYRFSNLDIARISEGLKTSGSGVLNADNWSYITLRMPDYLNRMVLFSARMHHDGVDDAYYIKDGKLIYDWTKDKRFSVYLDPQGQQKNLEEYNKQRSKYLSLLRQFNNEGKRVYDDKHPEGRPLQEGDALPDAYTESQIGVFKNFADNIYGSYNQSTRAKYEQTALGRQFGIFSTWMNSIVDVYAKKKQISRSETKEVQETDANGKPLFFDKNGNITETDTGVPVMKDIPIMVQGVFNTMIDFCKEFAYELNENGFDVPKAYKFAVNNVYNYDINKRNFRRALYDMLMWLLIGGAFTMFFDPAYEDHKKNADGQNIIANGLIEITYKATSHAYDNFKGPLAVLDYIGNSTNPAVYKLPARILNDSWKLATGDKTMGGFLMGLQAFPRAFQDSYRMYIRDNK